MKAAFIITWIAAGLTTYGWLLESSERRCKPRSDLASEVLAIAVWPMTAAILTASSAGLIKFKSYCEAKS